MKASEMIATIKYVEKECCGITQIYAERISIFQSKNLPFTQGVEYDSAFDAFVVEMESVLKSKLYIPTAKKILNNWYLWAKGNLDALRKIEPFVKAGNPIDWLIKNNFRVDHKRFAESAEEGLIQNVKEQQMPYDSQLFQELKAVADNTHPGKRGFSYPYLVKVVAGFSAAWQ